MRHEFDNGVCKHCGMTVQQTLDDKDVFTHCPRPIFYFHVQIDAKGAGEALYLLHRALNTLEPKDWPEWAQPMIDRLERIVNEQA